MRKVSLKELYRRLSISEASMSLTDNRVICDLKQEGPESLGYSFDARRSNWPDHRVKPEMKNVMGDALEEHRICVKGHHHLTISIPNARRGVGGHALFMSFTNVPAPIMRRCLERLAKYWAYEEYERIQQREISNLYRHMISESSI